MKHPLQPLYVTESGVLRFHQNKIVSDMLDFSTSHGFGLNEIACRQYSQDDRIQFAQLIGYSHSGFGDLSYVDDQSYLVALDVYESGETELQARIDFLEGQLSRLKAALREPMAELFEVHPDDLRGRQ